MTETLEDILKDIEPDSLPPPWQWREEDLKKFSNEKNLFDFQQKALQATIKALWLYYGQEENEEDRGKKLKECYENNGLGDEITGFDVNRMSYWMATGSGKTLVIVKLIELLALLGEQGAMIQHDIMFLVYRENLLKQFMTHVDEYNASNLGRRINLINLQDYEKTKNENIISFSDSVDVFYYRADLFVEKESTAKKINTNSCDNGGKWFVLLDEAHKGYKRNKRDKDDSTLQKIYSKFARKGFLFNFSATFTDNIDLVTCVYNYNLEKFIENGYGKKIYVSGENIEGFKEQNDFSDIEKQKIVLKALILYTYIKQDFKKIRKVKDGMYHNPLLLTIVHKVTDQDSDLRMFFSEIEKIAGGKINGKLFNTARQELSDEFKDATYLFNEEKITINWQALLKIVYKDVLLAFFNTTNYGKIEVIRSPSNRQELIFKMQTAEKPFALIRIGDTSSWVKEILADYETNAKYDDMSAFSQINEDSSDINILMGSRTFYEGWDSNRPNIILFVNIGVSGDSKKFVLQSVGRGVRIEPVKHKRRRVQNLKNAGVIDSSLFAKIKDNVASLESLFVFGTNANNLTRVIESLKGKNTEKTFDLGDEFTVNTDAESKLLLIPTYVNSGELLADTQVKYPISEDDLNLTKSFFTNLNDKVMLVKYESTPQILEKAKEKMEEMSADQETPSIEYPELIAQRMLDYFSLEDKKFDKFNPLTKCDIVHFAQIKFRGSKEDYETLKERIAVIRENPNIEEKLNQAYDKGREEYDKQKFLFENAKSFEVDNQKTNIENIAKHYYHPILISDKDKIAYLTHIVDVPSEIKFINELKSIINDIDEKFDWWFFSKLDQTLDKVYVPYYSGAQNKYAKFNPDFIFWLKKGDNYSIVFIDPKGGTYTDYQHKADGYAQLFGAPEAEQLFNEHGMNIKVYLRFFGDDVAKQPQEYRPYWIDKAEDVFADIS